jgi:hypothetical protein
MKHLVDFHTHTNFSDGDMTLAELILQAQNKGLRLLAVTDHDTFDTFSEENIKKTRTVVPQLRDEGYVLAVGGLQVIKGIEFSVNYHDEVLHIIGLYVNNIPAFVQNQFKKIGMARRKRAENIAAHARVSIDDVLRAAGKATSITRLHVAKALFDKKYAGKEEYREWRPYDVVKSILDKRGVYYRGLSETEDGVFSAKPALDLIVTQLRGIPVWAHPGTDKVSADPATLEDAFKELNGFAQGYLLTEDSLNYNEKKNADCIAVAKKAGIPVLPSSDYHGRMKRNELGRSVSDDEYQRITRMLSTYLREIRAKRFKA